MDDANLIFKLRVLADVEESMYKSDPDPRAVYMGAANARMLREAANRIEFLAAAKLEEFLAHRRANRV